MAIQLGLYSVVYYCLRDGCLTVSFQVHGTTSTAPHPLGAPQIQGTSLPCQPGGQHEMEIEIEGIRVRGTNAPNCPVIDSGASSQQPQQPSGLPEGSVPVDPADFGITEDKPGYTLWKSPANRLFWVRN